MTLTFYRQSRWIITPKVFPLEYWFGLTNPIASRYETIYFYMQSILIGFSRVDTKDGWFFKKKCFKKFKKESQETLHKK